MSILTEQRRPTSGSRTAMAINSHGSTLAHFLLLFGTTASGGAGRATVLAYPATPSRSNPTPARPPDVRHAGQWVCHGRAGGYLRA